MKKRDIALLMIISLFVVACNGQEPAPTLKGAFLGGTQGITAEFESFGVEEGGVDTIFDEESFAMEVTLRNKGEYDLKSGDVEVKLLGPSQDEFTGIPSWTLKNTGTIDAISDLVPGGGEETLSYANNARYITPVSGSIDREWFGNIEYRYNTRLIIPEVCLKEDLTDERVCTVKEPKTYWVSGAPITVRSVEEDTAGKGVVALKIRISNVGNGKVTKPGEDFGVRNTLSYTIDDNKWECKSAGKIGEARLDNNDAEILCKLKTALAEGTLATKQLQLTFDYKYRDIISSTLRIKESQ